MLLDVYDLFKKTLKELSIQKSLTEAARGRPHAADEPIREYEVINHRKGECQRVKFTMNTSNLQGKQTILKQVELPKELVK